MKKLKTFQDAFNFQTNNGNVNDDLETGVVNIDRVQFSLGNIVWVILADGYNLDDYEEWVTQYGVTSEGKWCAVSGGHCSCYEWEEMSEGDVTYYPSLEILLKADKGANIILTHKKTLKQVFPFLKFL